MRTGCRPVPPKTKNSGAAELAAPGSFPYLFPFFLFLLFLSVPFVARNEARSLAPDAQFSVLTTDRDRLYFGDRRDVAESYVAAANLVGDVGCRSVGLDLSTDVGLQYEYGLLGLLKPDRGREVRAVGVTNPSGAYSGDAGAFKPCVVICVRCALVSEKWGRYGADDGEPAVFGDIVAFTSGG